MWITNMTVAVCMSCTNKTHWEKAERISTEQRFTQLRPWQSSLGPGLKCIESGDIWRIADHLVHNYEEVISNIFKRSWNMNNEYVYIYIILSICIFTHFIPTVLTNLSTFGRSKAPNTAVIRVALFRIDTSGRGVLPHWCHGTGLWFMDSTCAMDWSGMFTSDLQISGIYIIYTVVYYWIIIQMGFLQNLQKYKPILRPFQTAVKIRTLFHEIRGNQHVLRTSPGNPWAVASSKDRGDHLQYLPIASPYKTLKW